jgi:hypothetical protein
MMLRRSFFAKAPNIPSEVYQDSAGNSYADRRLVEFLAVAPRFKLGKPFSRSPRPKARRHLQGSFMPRCKR